MTKVNTARVEAVFRRHFLEECVESAQAGMKMRLRVSNGGKFDEQIDELSRFLETGLQVGSLGPNMRD